MCILSIKKINKTLPSALVFVYIDQYGGRVDVSQQRAEAANAGLCIYMSMHVGMDSLIYFLSLALSLFHSFSLSDLPDQDTRGERVSSTLWPPVTPFPSSQFSGAARPFSSRSSPSDLSRIIFALGYFARCI